MKLKNFDLQAKESGETELNLGKDVTSNMDLRLRFLRVVGINARTGNAHTKKRSEVRGGGKKPWKQKGTGRARAGSTRSPLWVGGGVSNGPRAKDWHADLNKKMKKGAFLSSLVAKFEDGKDTLLTVDFSELKAISSKNAQQFCKSMNLSFNTLLIHDSEVLFKSFRNLKNVKPVNVKDVNALDVELASKVIIEKNAVDSLAKRF